MEVLFVKVIKQGEILKILSLALSHALLIIYWQ